MQIQLKKILSINTFNYSFLDQILVSGTNFLSTILIARMLSLYDFGVFASLWLILLFINSLHSAIIVFPMMTLAPKQEKLKSYFGSVFIFQIIFLLLAFFFSYIFSYCYMSYISKEISLSVLFLFSLVVFLYHAQDFFRRYFFIKKYFKDVIILDSISYIIRLILLVYLMIFPLTNSLEEILIIFSLTFLLGVFYGIIKFRFSFHYACVKKDLIKTWKLSKWLLPSGLMQWTSINSFLLAASFILGPVAVGIIRLGQNIAQVFNVILQAIENFIPIEASIIYQKRGYESLLIYIKKIVIIGSVISLFFSVLLILFSNKLFHFIYGPEYVQYSYILYWYSLILLFMFLLPIFRIFLRTIEKTKIWFNGYLVSSIYSLLVLYPLINYYEINGVLFGVLSSYLVLILYVYYYFNKNTISLK